LLVALSGAASAGCAATYIPNTDVMDTPDNRDIIAFCEVYRRAVERRDANAMLKMTSTEYYEDGGNPDASDDMDYVEFKAWITGENFDQTGLSFQDATAIRHEIRYRRIVYDDTRIYVDYTFSASFKVPTPNGDQWKRKVDDNRLELVKDEHGEFKVIAGM
jgi:hypothetical protein